MRDLLIDNDDNVNFVACECSLCAACVHYSDFSFTILYLITAVTRKLDAYCSGTKRITKKNHLFFSKTINGAYILYCACKKTFCYSTFDILALAKQTISVLLFTFDHQQSLLLAQVVSSNSMFFFFLKKLATIFQILKIHIYHHPIYVLMILLYTGVHLQLLLLQLDCIW